MPMMNISKLGAAAGKQYVQAPTQILIENLYRLSCGIKNTYYTK